ncbi:hypothetical protein JB92DRAFT_2216222 [Gautieria morchelliformis]|nr:hypothetical protein JB92DRAFT_2216222 [Gautieria morchelliformis]
MARTRAKLAKLSASGAELSQTPVGGVIVISDTPSASASASASAHPDAPAAGATSRVSPSAADLRSRLMARLKEEKRHATLCSDETPAENPTSSLGPGASSSKSARDIMARTRAKLAKLSASGAEPSQTPVGGVIVLSDTPSASASAHPDAPAAGATSRVSPSTADLRSRLMARLAEEKRHATASGVQPSPPRDRDQAPLTKETPGIGIDATKGSSTPETTKMSISISSQAQQAEAKLRAQALLRVRLAAEKRRADVGPGLREEALRARLLSRRTT